MKFEKIILAGIIFPLFLLPAMIKTQTACSSNQIVKPSGLTLNCPEEDWNLVFYDDFEGSTLNSQYWYTHYGDEPIVSAPHDKAKWQGCDRETQIYLSQNVIVNNGYVRLIAKVENYNYSGITQSEVIATAKWK